MSTQNNLIGKWTRLLASVATILSALEELGTSMAKKMIEELKGLASEARAAGQALDEAKANARRRKPAIASARANLERLLLAAEVWGQTFFKIDFPPIDEIAAGDIYVHASNVLAAIHGKNAQFDGMAELIGQSRDELKHQVQASQNDPKAIQVATEVYHGAMNRLSGAVTGATGWVRANVPLDHSARRYIQRRHAKPTPTPNLQPAPSPNPVPPPGPVVTPTASASGNGVTPHAVQMPIKTEVTAN